MWKLSLVLLIAACTERDREVCCTTAADCASLGISADKVGSYGCGDGLVCIDFGCVVAPDAPPDGDPSRRCNPEAEFGPPELVPNLNNGYTEDWFSMTEDELEAFIVRDERTTIKLYYASRSTKLDEFSRPDAHAVLEQVYGSGSGIKDAPSSTAEGLELYFRIGGRLHVSSRTTRSEPFSVGSAVTVDTAPSMSGFVGISASGRTLYWRNPADGILTSAPNIGGPKRFGTPQPVSTVRLDNAVIAPDQLTVYYAVSGQLGVWRATRTSTSSMFGPGSEVSTLASALPLFVTGDDCLLYVSAADPETQSIDIMVARRPR